ncbi:ABC transporter permease [Nocardioides sp.]|uniref:ABC transporter permease n=1 Tax=Nocardioides sp. TaxID=35761 RepID=UPI00262901F3|nr:ABC transporter permease [Nocardioides sp.]MDI6908576.1 ABC transporter permease [Nocardioides sp.]
MTEANVGQTTPAPPARRAFSLDLAHGRDLGIVACFVALFLALTFSSDVFFSAQNFATILEQWAPVMIIAVAGTLVLVAGDLDISVGAIFAISGVAAAKFANDTGSVILGCVAAVIAGLACGLVNAAITLIGRVNSLIGTLGSSLVIRGLALLITGGFIVQAAPVGFDTLGVDSWLGLRWSVWVMFVWVGAVAVLLHLTVFGRRVFAVGGNIEAARLAGIPVGSVKAVVFVVSGMSAGLAGLLAASKVNAGQAEVGVGLEFQVLAAIVLGGTSLAGGAGAVWRTVLGVMILAMIGNGLNLLAVDPVYQQIVQGTIVVTAVAVDAWAQRGRNKT